MADGKFGNKQMTDILVLANMAYRLDPAQETLDLLEEPESLKELVTAFKNFQDVSTKVINEDLKKRNMTKEQLVK